MTVYWILLAFPALMALAFPRAKGRHGLLVAQAFAFAAFVLFYTLLAWIRDEVGADWFAYTTMYQQARIASFGDALGITDTLFSFLLWFSGQFDWGVYPVNAICALLLAIGVVRLALLLEEPWLAVAAAVPYLLIVVGMGYVRQAGAIGMALIAIAELARGRTWRTGIALLVSIGLHSTAVCVVPFVGLALAERNKLRIFLLATVGSVVLYFILQRQFAQFETTYIDTDYQSSGAVIRIAMSVLASLLVLARWRSFTFPPRTRPLWLGFAAVNLLAFVALGLTESSTAVDRISLYFAPIQIFAFGNLRQLAGFGSRFVPVMRLLVLGITVAVQLVWLVYASHADNWVPYRSLFDTI